MCRIAVCLAQADLRESSRTNRATMAQPIPLNTETDTKRPIRGVLLEIASSKDEDGEIQWGGEPSGQFAADGVELRWVHMLSVGPLASNDSRGIEFTKEHILSMVEDYSARMKADKAKSAGNYHHNGLSSWEDSDPNLCKAVGYVWALEARDSDSQVWGLVEWTSEAFDRIKAKEYRYVSAELDFPDARWSTDEGYELGESATFHGFALTNNPAVESQTGLFGRTPSPGPGPAHQEPQMLSLLTALGLTKEASEQDAIQVLQALKTAHSTEVETLTTARDAALGQVEGLQSRLTEIESAAMKAACDTSWSEALRAHRALPAQEELFKQLYTDHDPETAERMLLPEGTFKALTEASGVEGDDPANPGAVLTYERASEVILKAIGDKSHGGEGLTEKEARVKYPMAFRIYEGGDTSTSNA